MEGSPSSQGASVTGTLRVLNRTGTGVLRGSVDLLEASLQDAPARVAASAKIVLPVGSSEAVFQLLLPSEIDARTHYLIAGRLEGTDLETGRNRLFGTTVAYPWTPGARNVVVEVRPWN